MKLSTREDRDRFCNQESNSGLGRHLVNKLLRSGQLIALNCLTNHAARCVYVHYQPVSQNRKGTKKTVESGLASCMT